MSETPKQANPNYDPQAFYEKQCLDLVDIQTKQAAEMERIGITPILNDLVAKKYGPELINGLSRPMVYFERENIGNKRIHRYGITIRTKDPALAHEDSYVGSECPIPVVEVDAVKGEYTYPNPEFHPLQVKAMVEMAGELKEAAKTDLPNLSSGLTRIDYPG